MKISDFELDNWNGICYPTLNCWYSETATYKKLRPMINAHGYVHNVKLTKNGEITIEFYSHLMDELGNPSVIYILNYGDPRFKEIINRRLKHTTERN